MIKLIHHIPGRVRFRLPQIANHPDTTPWLKQGLMGIQGVQQIRVNEAACSITIHYDNQLLTPLRLEERLALLEWNESQPGEHEHEFTRGEVALNVVGTLAASLLPGRWGSLPTLPLIAPTIQEGVESISEGKLKVEALDAIAIGLAASRGDYRTAMLTQSLLTLGEYMEQETSRNSDRVLADLMAPNTSQVWVRRGDETIQINSDKIQEQEVILLGPGDPVPADGKILDGTALVNQSSLTGESVPVRREPDAYLYSGSVIQDGNITMQAEKVGSEATTARIAHFIAESLSQQSETQQVTQQMADRRVKITLGVGAAVFAMTRDINRLASVFLVDYSCALKLSTPVTFKSIMYRAAQQGILLKGGRAIEQLADIDTCVFDKTGTLTYGDMEVTDVVCFNEQDCTRELLAIAASVEEHCQHPLSQAIVNAAKHHDLPHIEHGEVEYVIAHGLRSTLNGMPLVIGSRHFLEAHEQVDFSDAESQIAELEQQGRHLLYVSSNHQLVGIIGLRDHLRPEVAEILTQLRQSGIKQLVLLTGDKASKANEIGKRFGFDRIYAEATPESKSSVVEDLQQAGHRVMFIGDGVNDAPALVQADVGMAMAQGTELAQQTADTVLLNSTLHGVAEARWLALEAMKLVKSNIRLAETVNSGIMLAAALGKLSPAASALLHNGTTLAVLLRSLAARKG
ncbi:heavy metal translocating P-type ATPase [uncultured Photobacterium sp.]|uniref:heavy metal translocating P-type ATPase n=1 Tax=uncultured Photobacterium sp. TaxID=173973 RepID=UPI002617D867|nr:heavy metal translocating P-type ATPase [uncultured Photobacterium sp.]